MGKIQIDHTGSGGGITLSSDGTSLLVDGAAVAGGSPMFADNYDNTSTLPSATGTNTIAIGIAASATGTRSIAFTNSNSSGEDSFAAGMRNNSTSYGATNRRSIAFGQQSRSSGDSAVTLGIAANATAYISTAIGGFVDANASYGMALGYQSHTRGNAGKLVYASSKFGTYGGGSQYGLLVLSGVTTDNTPRKLTIDKQTATSSNQIKVYRSSTYGEQTAIAFTIMLVARGQETTDDAAAWRIEGLVRRDDNVVTLVNSITSIISNPSNWGVSISANDTTESLELEVTGATGVNINWVATVQIAECAG